jgi:hypothetical protein
MVGLLGCDHDLTKPRGEREVRRTTITDASWPIELASAKIACRTDTGRSAWASAVEVPQSEVMRSEFCPIGQLRLHRIGVYGDPGLQITV